MAFIGYGLTYWGIALVRGWDLTLGECFSPFGYYKGSWPPPAITDPNVLLPNGKSQSSSSGSLLTQSELNGLGLLLTAPGLTSNAQSQTGGSAPGGRHYTP